jgi:hypothetical protein
LALFFLATPLLLPHAFLLLELRFILFAQQRTRLKKIDKREEGGPAYHLGAHPSLVEYEPAGLLGLG